MNKRPIDRTKKSNIKCEHCKHWNRDTQKCQVQDIYKAYWCRCSGFEWPDEEEI